MSEPPADGVAFTCPFEVRWADLDGNRHVRNTAFSEYATHTRFRLLAAHVNLLAATVRLEHATGRDRVRR